MRQIITFLRHYKIVLISCVAAQHGLKPKTADRNMVDYGIEHQLEVFTDLSNIIPISIIGRYFAVIHYRKTIIRSPWIKRKNMNTSYGIQQVRLAKFSQHSKRMFTRLLHLIGISYKNRIALIESP